MRLVTRSSPMSVWEWRSARYDLPLSVSPTAFSHRGWAWEVRWTASSVDSGIFWKRSRWLLVLFLLLPPALSALIAAMPLLSTSHARVKTQKNVSSQYNIISIPLANSLFPIAETPLSKSAWATANQSDRFQIRLTNKNLLGNITSNVLASKTASASASGRISSMSSSSSYASPNNPSGIPQS